MIDLYMYGSLASFTGFNIEITFVRNQSLGISPVSKNASPGESTPLAVVYTFIAVCRQFLNNLAVSSGI
jgi:hypothetical protein